MTQATAAAYRAPETQAQLILDDSQSAFLEAWKAGVTLAGPHLFHAGAENDLARAQHWHVLAPDMQRIRKAIPNHSQGDAAFLATMASFYNDAEGERLLTKTGTTLGKLPLILNRRQRGVLVALMTHYHGW